MIITPITAGSVFIMMVVSCAVQGRCNACGACALAAPVAAIIGAIVSLRKSA